LRTVTNGKAKSSEHTSTPNPPRQTRALLYAFGTNTSSPFNKHSLVYSFTMFYPGLLTVNMLKSS
jgi:hypothetical protein